MSYREETIIHGIRCDARGCAAEISDGPRDYFEGFDVYARAAASEGWTCWVGRSQRHYCPDHGPSRGSKARRNTRGRWSPEPRDSATYEACIEQGVGEREARAVAQEWGKPKPHDSEEKR